MLLILPYTYGTNIKYIVMFIFSSETFQPEFHEHGSFLINIIQISFVYKQFTWCSYIASFLLCRLGESSGVRPFSGEAWAGTHCSRLCSPPLDDRIQSNKSAVSRSERSEPRHAPNPQLRRRKAALHHPTPSLNWDFSNKTRPVERLVSNCLWSFPNVCPKALNETSLQNMVLWIAVS